MSYNNQGPTSIFYEKGQATPVAAHKSIHTTAIATPEFLVVLVDDVDLFSCSGFVPAASATANLYKTPFINSLIASGLMLTNFRAQPVCGVTRASLMTGRYVKRHGFSKNIITPTEYTLPATEKTIAEAIRDASLVPYKKAWIGKVHITYNDGTKDNFPLDRGFDLHKGTMENMTETIDGGIGNSFHWIKVENGVRFGVGTSSGPYDETTYAPAINKEDYKAFMAGETSPTVSYVAFGPPHERYLIPPSSLLSNDTISQLIASGYTPGLSANSVSAGSPAPLFCHQAMYESVDKCIEDLWYSIPKRRRDRITLIIVGDNGVESTVVQSPLAGDRVKRTANEGGIRVPCLVMSPFIESPGRQTSALSDITDITATIYDYCRVDLPSIPITDGVSWRPLFENINPSSNALKSFTIHEVFSPFGVSAAPTTGQRAIVRHDKYKYIRSYVNSVITKEEYYNLNTDPLENTNLILVSPNAEPLVALKAALIAYTGESA